MDVHQRHDTPDGLCQVLVGVSQVHAHSQPVSIGGDLGQVIDASGEYMQDYQVIV